MNRKTVISLLGLGLGISAAILPAADWATYTTADGLGSNLVYGVAFDNTGTTWCGSYDGRLCSLAPSSSVWISADARSTTLPGYGGCAVAAAAADDIWFGSSNGISRYNGSSFSFITAADGLPHNSIKALLAGDAGTVWAATLGGVARYSDGTWTTYTSANGLADDQVFSLAVDGSGTLWAGSMTGISEFNGTGWTKRQSATWVTSLTVDTDGDLWAGYQDGIYRYDGSAWTQVTGIETGGADQIHTVRAAVADMTGNVWFALTRTIWENGASAYRDLQNVLRWDGAAWTVFDSTDGLASGFVRCIGIDRNNVKWFGTDKGLTSYAADYVGIDDPVRSPVLPQPNPFRSSLRILLPDGFGDTVGIYTADGRRITILEVPENTAAVYWDGTDDTGKTVPRGIYWCRTEGKAGAITVKVIKTD